MAEQEGVHEVRTIFADPTDETIIVAPVYGPQADITSIARMLRNLPGVGKPFIALTAIPAAIDANPAADLTPTPSGKARVVTNSIADNETLINAMLLDSDLQDLPATGNEWVYPAE